MNYQFRNSFIGKLPAALSVLLLAGCAALPPKDAAPVLASTKATDFAPAGTAEWPAAQWWQQFNDAQLDSLIKQALADSPSLAVARARIDQASAAVGQTTANGGVALSLDGQASRQLYPIGSIYPPPLAGTYQNSGKLDLNLSYDFDFWGRNRNAIEAALGQRAAARADADAAAIALSASVVKAYFQWQALDARIKVIDAIERDRKALVEIEAKRVKAGVTAGEGLHPLIADAAAPRQTRVQLETQRDQVRYQLQSLTGGHALPALQSQALPQGLDGVPANLHLDLLARRPDVAAARDRVQASLKQVDSARAAFYPDFSISAFLGFNSLRIGSLLHADSREQGITPALHLPLFDAGRLRANLNIQRADVELAVAQYDQAVQTAVAEVNDATVHLAGVEREAPSLQSQTQARQRDLAAAVQRSKAGLADRREVLRDQLGLYALQDQEISRQAQALSARVDLIKALGGGYTAPDTQAQR